MHLVPGGGQFDAKFGGPDAAAAVGGIAGDSDLHSVSAYSLSMRSRARACESAVKRITLPPQARCGCTGNRKICRSRTTLLQHGSIPPEEEARFWNAHIRLVWGRRTGGLSCGPGA